MLFCMKMKSLHLHTKKHKAYYEDLTSDLRVCCHARSPCRWPLRPLRRTRTVAPCTWCILSSDISPLHLVIVVDVAWPGAWLVPVLQGRALEGPHPVLVMVAVDADHTGDGLTLWTLEIEVAIVIIDPFLAEPACGKIKDKKWQQQHNLAVLMIKGGPFYWWIIWR